MALSENLALQLARVLADLDWRRGADAEIREEGHLWIRHKTTSLWLQSVHIPPAAIKDARAFLRDYFLETDRPSTNEAQE